MGDPLISILLPTRKRVDSLRQAIDGCVSLAHNQSNLEFLFKVDDDDTETIEFLEWFKTLGIKTQVIISPRGNGYHDMHLWMNQMAELATGKWLFIYNDDAKVITQDWDAIFVACIEQIGKLPTWHGNTDVCCCSITTEDRPGAREFFFIPKKVYEIVGCLARVPHVDTWFTTLMDLVNGSFALSQIVAKHHSHIEDSVREEGLPARQAMEYTRKASTELLRQKLADAEKLLTYLDNNHISRNASIEAKYEITDADTIAFLNAWEEPPLGSKILEVASHDEPVANILAEKGYNVYGIDMREYNPLQDTEDKKHKLYPECNYNYIRSDFCNMEDAFIKEHMGTFDDVVCLSAIEHFGLGTYGEAIHPYYDVIAMRWIWHMLKENGVCYISVPYGGRFIEKYPHWRIYNKKEANYRIVQDFRTLGVICFIADTIEIGENKYAQKGQVISLEEANSYMGTVPHISILLKLQKVPINRTVADGR